MSLALALAGSALAGPFDRPLALAGYASGWSGSYAAGGLGGRLRIEPRGAVGVDLFAEHYLVRTPIGLRHDHPIGFDLFLPVEIPHGLRLKPLLGACVVGSFIESSAEDAPGADDVLFGVHAGLGLEVPVAGWISGFLEARGVGWMGHDRAVQGWTGSVDSALSAFAVAQAGFGLTAHFGAPRR